MKHVYYADEKDAAKWTIVLRHRPAGGGVLQVAMMPAGPAGGPPRNGFRSMPATTDSVVRGFFDAERARILGGEPRDAGRIVGMDPAVRFCNPRDYAWSCRNAYFDDVVGALKVRTGDRPDLVLLDPCTGLSLFTQAPDDRHLDTESLREVWQALRAGDRLMVFQYAVRHLGKAWPASARAAVATACGMSWARVIEDGLNKAVRFFVVERLGE